MTSTLDLRFLLLRVLFRANDIGTVWLLDLEGEPPIKVKRGFPKWEVFDRYHFDRNKVENWNVPLDSISYPTGSTFPEEGYFSFKKGQEIPEAAREISEAAREISEAAREISEAARELTTGKKEAQKITHSRM